MKIETKAYEEKMGKSISSLEYEFGSISPTHGDSFFQKALRLFHAPS